MSTVETSFSIPKEKHEAALEALKKLVAERCYTPEGVEDAKTLAKAMSYFSWDTIADDAGNIIEIIFSGDKASSNDEPFMTTLAPFVDSGSYIGMIGEDSTLWAWVFEDGKVREETVSLTWAGKKE